MLSARSAAITVSAMGWRWPGYLTTKRIHRRQPSVHANQAVPAPVT